MEAEQAASQAASSDLVPWLRSLGLSHEESLSIVLHLKKPEYGVTNLVVLRALTEADLDEVFKNLPLGQKRLLKQASSSVAK